MATATDRSVEEKVKAYSLILFRAAYSVTGNRVDAEDAVQEAFARWTGRQFLSVEHEKAWLIRTTINRAKSLMTSSWNRRAVFEEPVEACSSVSDYSELRQAVSKLQGYERVCIHLYYFEDMSVGTIAATLRMRENTVKSHLNRARAKLKSLLKGVYDEF